MFKDFRYIFFKKLFSGLSNETMYFIFGLLQQVFKLTKAQSVETLHHSKCSSKTTCPRHGNFGVWGMLRID